MPVVGIIDDDMADADPPADAHRDGVGPPLTRTEPDKDGRIDDVAHGYIRDGDVFQYAAIYRLQRQPPGIIEDTIRDRDIPESAIGLGPHLDPPRRGTVGIVFIGAFK